MMIDPEDPQQWEQRAREALAVAERMLDSEAQRVLLSIVDGYEVLARLAKERRGLLH
jgi:hypothetical protein